MSSTAQTGVIGVGTVLAGKYRIDKVLGEGGMGVVAAATHVQLDEPVAIKLLHAHLATQTELVQRFQREAKAARKIRSEHVVRILDVGELENGAPFMVMEYLAGTDLDALIRSQGPRSVIDAVDFVLQACEALAEAHVQGMVHRDLKPANLFVAKRADETPLIKVLDFGISKVTGKDGADLGVTKTNSGVLGSPLYMAPEQMRSLRDVDARTDIWALGTIIHELLAGAPPFHATTLTELCAAILQDPPVPIRTARPDVPPALEAAILRCLSKDPAGRYPDVAALAMDLHAFASISGRASAERIFGVYRVAGVPRGSTPPLAIESARTMWADPTGPSLPAAVTPRSMPPPPLGVMTTGKVWTSGSIPAPVITTPPPAKNNVVVIALVAMVAVLLTAVVMLLLLRPRLAPAQALVSAAPTPSVSAAPSAAPTPLPAASASVDPAASASAAPLNIGRAPAAKPRGASGAKAPPTTTTKPDCSHPFYYDEKGARKVKTECVGD